MPKRTKTKRTKTKRAAAKVRVQVLLPVWLIESLQERADFEGRSLSNLIGYLVRAAVEEEG